MKKIKRKIKKDNLFVKKDNRELKKVIRKSKKDNLFA